MSIITRHFGLLTSLVAADRFFPTYRNCAYPFNPIVADIEKFEGDMCILLEDLEAGELHDPGRISSKWSSNDSIAFIALLLATLSA